MVVVAPAPAVATPADETPAKVEKMLWVVVTGTASTKDAARKLRDHYLKDTPGHAFVRVYDTNKIPSLKPGLFLISPIVLEDRASADRMVKQFDSVFPGTYTRAVEESLLYTLGFPQYSPTVCDGEPVSRACVADGKWRLAVAVSNSVLPPNATGPGQFEGRDASRIRLSGFTVVPASLPEDKSVSVMVEGGKMLKLNLTPYADKGPGLLLYMEGKDPVFSPYRIDGYVDPAEYFGARLYDMDGMEPWGPDALGEQDMKRVE